MAKELKTRIKNRFDSLNSWQGKDAQGQLIAGANVELLPGEIALVRVTAQHTDDQGHIVHVPTVLMKVGDVVRDSNGDPVLNNGKEQPIAFNDLPWLSAKAADVYDWAKKSAVEDVNVKVITSTDPATGEVVYTPYTLSNWLKNHYDALKDHAARLTDLEEMLDLASGTDGSGEGTVVGFIDAKISSLVHSNAGAIEDADDDPDTQPTPITNTIVKAVTQTDGKVTVNYGKITNAELSDINVPDLVYSSTDAVGTPGEDGYQAATKTTLGQKFTEVNAAIQDILDTIEGGTHFIGITNEKPYINAEDNNYTYAKIKQTDNSTYLATKAIAGDIVIYVGSEETQIGSTEVVTFEREYISTGTAWQELGDLSRVGALTEYVNKLTFDSSNIGSDVAPTDNKFVTSVTQEKGQISVTYARPKADDIEYGATTDGSTGATVTTTVKDILASHNGDLTTIKDTYIHIGTGEKPNLYVGSDTIIFDCGGAMPSNSSAE